eukprot:Selendium_serpulae@DN5266_c0_g1_i1.p1
MSDSVSDRVPVCQGCGNETSTLLVCPNCSKIGRSSFFCSQDCFRTNWAAHNRLHIIMQQQVHNHMIPPADPDTDEFSPKKSKEAPAETASTSSGTSGTSGSGGSGSPTAAFSQITPEESSFEHTSSHEFNAGDADSTGVKENPTTPPRHEGGTGSSGTPSATFSDSTVKHTPPQRKSSLTIPNHAAPFSGITRNTAPTSSPDCSTQNKSTQSQLINPAMVNALLTSPVGQTLSQMRFSITRGINSVLTQTSDKRESPLAPAPSSLKCEPNSSSAMHRAPPSPLTHPNQSRTWAAVHGRSSANSRNPSDDSVNSQLPSSTASSTTAPAASSTPRLPNRMFKIMAVLSVLMLLVKGYLVHQRHKKAEANLQNMSGFLNQQQGAKANRRKGSPVRGSGDKDEEVIRSALSPQHNQEAVLKSINENSDIHDLLKHMNEQNVIINSLRQQIGSQRQENEQPVGQGESLRSTNSAQKESPDKVVSALNAMPKEEEDNGAPNPAVNAPGVVAPEAGAVAAAAEA